MSLVPNGYSLRKATGEDRLAIKRMVRTARLNPLNLQWERFVVALDGRARIIGCGQVRPHSNGSWELASLVVDPDWRRRGVASAIVRRLTELNDHSLWLTCASVLVPFYERFGFRKVDGSSAIPWTFRLFARGVNAVLQLIGRDNTMALMVREPTD